MYTRETGRCLTLIFLVIYCSAQAVSAEEGVQAGSRNREKRNTQNLSLTDLVRAISGGNDGDNPVDLSQFAPTTPRPEDVNCHVEVPTTILVGGQCIHLGGSGMACQAGAYLAFTSDCLNVAPPTTVAPVIASAFRRGMSRSRSRGGAPRRRGAFQTLMRTRRQGPN